ncbi:Gpi transamidase component gpi16 subunit family protein [Thalictrum thalictroides]|uniref:Gpi transamidase component gpi16 subunit family protein n=1 Tax=Thalictrum thalictroides TaxID=46969 RepID=A0A7J6XCE4_THATH|nr:Gpi transamidase component gpi16 subunit family protein [Thalictrum thalictroides]
MAKSLKLFGFIIVIFTVLSHCCNGRELVVEEEEEVFTEELLLRPLPDGRVLSHFHFQSDSQRSRTTDGMKLQPSWSIRSVFGPLCRNSIIQYWDNAAFELTVTPTRVIKEEESSLYGASAVIYEFDLYEQVHSAAQLQDIGLTWKLAIIWACLQAPFHASRFLVGSGNERGSIAISLRSTQSGKGSRVDNAVDGSKVKVVVFQVFSCYVKVYFHTLRVFVDGQPMMVADIVEKMHISPSNNNVSTDGAMEMIIRFPSDVNSVVVTMEFDLDDGISNLI